MRAPQILPVLVSVCLPSTFANEVAAVRKHRTGGTYDSDSTGNLKGMARLEPLVVTRNHALITSIEVGSPSQALDCMLDSGSADLWVPSFHCESCSEDERELKGFFHAERSSTFHPMFVKTSRGIVPQIVQVVYGGGTIGGFAAQDTVRFGQATLSNQSFLLAEEVDLVALKRPWDGVCGIGWRSLARSGVPLYSQLRKVGQAIITLVPAGLSHGDSAVLATGFIPFAEVQGPIAWTPALEPLSFWIVSGAVVQPGIFRTPARLLIDTGTTFLLVPPKKYFPMVRALIGQEFFDRLCGVDRRAGNIVICDCSVRDHDTGQSFSIELAGASGASFKLTLADVLQEVISKSRMRGSPASQYGKQLCELQVQQRPRPGAALAAALGRNVGRRGNHAFGQAPVGAPVEPFSVTIGAPLVGKRPINGKQGAAPRVPDWAQLPGRGAKNGEQGAATQETMIATMNDDTVCEIQVLRAANGTVLDLRASAFDQKHHGLSKSDDALCASKYKDQNFGDRTALVTRSGDAPKDVPALGGGLDNDDYVDDDSSDDLWVIGDVFFRRHVVIFDFESKRLGVAHPSKAISPTAAPPSSPQASARNPSVGRLHRGPKASPAAALSPAGSPPSSPKHRPVAFGDFLPDILGALLAAGAAVWVYTHLVQGRLRQVASAEFSVREASSFLHRAPASDIAEE